MLPIQGSGFERRSTRGPYVSDLPAMQRLPPLPNTSRPNGNGEYMKNVPTTDGQTYENLGDATYGTKGKVTANFTNPQFNQTYHSY